MKFKRHTLLNYTQVKFLYIKFLFICHFQENISVWISTSENKCLAQELIKNGFFYRQRHICTSSIFEKIRRKILSRKMANLKWIQNNNTNNLREK